MMMAEPAEFVWPPAIMVDDIEQVRLALSVARDAGRAVTLISAPAAANAVGVGFFAALVRQGREEFPDIPFRAVLDCHSAGGRAMAALHSGVDAIIYTGDGKTLLKLADIAEDHGVGLLPERLPAFEGLAQPGDVRAALAAWLERQA